MTAKTFLETQRDFLDAAEERGWRVMVLDMGGTIVLEDPKSGRELELSIRGLFVTPDFVRSLPMAPSARAAS